MNERCFSACVEARVSAVVSNASSSLLKAETSGWRKSRLWMNQLNLSPLLGEAPLVPSALVVGYQPSRTRYMYHAANSRKEEPCVGSIVVRIRRLLTY